MDAKVRELLRKSHKAVNALSALAGAAQKLHKDLNKAWKVVRSGPVEWLVPDKYENTIKRGVDFVRSASDTMATAAAVIRGLIGVVEKEGKS